MTKKYVTLIHTRVYGEGSVKHWLSDNNSSKLKWQRERPSEKCAMLVLKSGKRNLMDGIEVPNKEKIRTHRENEIYKNMAILEAGTIEQVEMKEIIKKEYLRRTRKLRETKLCSSNHIEGINTWTVPLVRYSGPFLK